MLNHRRHVRRGISSSVENSLGQPMNFRAIYSIDSDWNAQGVDSKPIWTHQQMKTLHLPRVSKFLLVMMVVGIILKGSVAAARTYPIIWPTSLLEHEHLRSVLREHCMRRRCQRIGAIEVHETDGACDSGCLLELTMTGTRLHWEVWNAIRRFRVWPHPLLWVWFSVSNVVVEKGFNKDN